MNRYETIQFSHQKSEMKNKVKSEISKVKTAQKTNPIQFSKSTQKSTLGH